MGSKLSPYQRITPTMTDTLKERAAKLQCDHDESEEHHVCADCIATFAATVAAEELEALPVRRLIRNRRAVNIVQHDALRARADELRGGGQ